jgi:hypothetical protein
LDEIEHGLFVVAFKVYALETRKGLVNQCIYDLAGLIAPVHVIAEVDDGFFACELLGVCHDHFMQLSKQVGLTVDVSDAVHALVLGYVRFCVLNWSFLEYFGQLTKHA